MRKRLLSILLSLAMVTGLLPTAAAVGAFAADEQPIMVNNYDELVAAVNNAKSGDTIELGAGTYTLYNKGADVKNKDLTFVGAGTGETTWLIGPTVPDPAKYGTEYNSDYSFDVRSTEAKETVTFKNMTLQSGSVNYLGFAGTDNTVVEDCVIEGKTFYWGYTSATFKNTTFKCPSGDYAIWTYSSPTMTFDNCTFNSSGKVINVYTDYDVGKHDIYVNFKDCTVKNIGHKKQALKINDTNMGDYHYIINISGNNTVEGIDPNNITCSRLFGFDENGENAGQTIVYIEDEKVWENGKRVGSHNHDFTTGSYNNGVATDDANKYTDGYKDDAFTTTYGSWAWDESKNKLARTVTKTCTYCGYEETTKETKDFELDVSRSKTATALDSSDQSTVTLSLPSAEENLASDVVFVLDGSSSADDSVVNESLRLLTELKEAISDSDASVKVCVVKFKRQAFKSDWFDLSKDYDKITAAMETKYSGGTNIHAGLLAGKEALEEHTNVPTNRKHLILISDGSTYLYSKDGNWASDTPFTRSYYTAENYQNYAGSFNDQGHYDPNAYTDVNVSRPKDTSDVETWQAYLKDVEARNAESHGDNYDYHCEYDNNFNKGIPSDDFKTQPSVQRSANNRDMAFYYADQVWQQIKDAGYNAYSIAEKDGSAGAGNADDSHCFMNYLNEGASLNFSDIEDDILYAVGAGSVVEDKMGDDFNFVPGSLKLTVGGKELVSKVDETDKNVVYFGDDENDLNKDAYRFKVVYDSTEDKFTWTINENVSNFAPVQLSYQVKLVNRNTAAGIYSVPTNEYATLTPKNSAGYIGKELEFNKPEVSYTVKNSSGGGGGGGGNSKPVVIPDKVPTSLNGDDHYAYIVGYPDSTVRPQNGITRAEVATIFFRLLTDEVRDKNSTKTNSYSDVASTDWYNHAVSTLSAMGIIKGDTHGKFNPNAPITRAEFAAIAARFDDKANTTTADFSDIASHWAKDEISAAANNGWINGYTDGTFRPDNNITRAEAMTLVNRVLKRLPETAEDLYDGMIKWSDNSDTSKWYYLAVQEATNSHYYETKNTQYEKWTKLRETRDWTELEK